MTDVSTLSLREALELVDPREAYFDLLVGKADWVALSAAVVAAEVKLAAVDSLEPGRQARARKAAEKQLAEAHAAYAPHVKRVWFDPSPEYEALRRDHADRTDLAYALLQVCARVPDDQRLSADEWRAFVKRWPASDRSRLLSTVLLLNEELTVPSLGKGFSPSR